MRYLFGGYALDPDRRELYRGESLIAVEPQVFDLLAHLIRNRERVVSRDDLIASIWGGRIVSESTLSTRINAARSAVGDSGVEQRFIKTLPRKGVRFVAAVKEERERPEPAAAEIATAPAEPDGPPQNRPSIAERRQLTVLSCELLLSAVPAGRMDPEDLRGIIDAYHRCVAETVARFEGFVGHSVGKMVLVYFGYPIAQEDDAEQALRAGLELCAAASCIEPRSDLRSQARVGISTGEVIVANPDNRETRDFVGEATGIASLLQSAAQPGTVLIDIPTRQLIGSLFDCRDVDPIEVSGSTATLQAWQVLKAGVVESRFEGLRGVALTPLVGREEELALLQRRWEHIKSGEERVVLIRGEPGIGKSRIIAALEERIQSENFARVHFSCSPHHTDSALYPFITHLERSAGLDRKDRPEEKFAKLDALLARTAAPAEEVALLADLLSVPTTYPPLDLGPQRKKDKTSAALVRHIACSAGLAPVLVIFEDVHWIDPTSLDVLSLMIERLHSLPILVLVTFRPGFEPHWLGQPNVMMLSLNRLGRQDGAALVRQVAGGVALPTNLLNEIVERTDGVPLFVEELTKAVLDASQVEEEKTVSWRAPGAPGVPATLQASLMARLDALGPAKQIAEIGAVIGREFLYDLLAVVAHRSDEELRSSLDQLVKAGLIFRRGIPPDAVFTFKHALVQDTAYGALPRSVRRDLHGRIADTLETQFFEVAEHQPEVLAHHFAEAGKADRSVQYWIKAGDLAIRRAAAREAVSHYRAALRKVDGQTGDSAIRQLEPVLCMKLGNALIQSEGYGSHSAIDAYRRAQTKATDLDQPENYAKSAVGLAPLLFSSCRYQEVVETIEEISERMLGRLQTHTHVHLYTMLGVANYCLGNFLDAWDQFEKARAIDRDSPCTHEHPIGGGDPAIVIRNYMGMTGAVLGRLEESLALTEEGLDLARERNDPFTVAWALLARARALRPLDRFADGILCANEAVHICEQYGFRARLGSVLMARGTLNFGLGDIERGLADMYLGIDVWRETSGNFHMSEWLSYLIDRLLRADRHNEADRVLCEAESIASETDEKSHLGELCRLRGNLLYRRGAADAAAPYLEHAIDWAGHRRAKVFELRARRDLARLYTAEGRLDAASVVLKPAFALFPEAPVFVDLREARQLLSVG